MSASAWDRAVEAAAGAMVLAQSNGCCDQWPKPCALCDCFREQRPDVMAGYERAHANAALVAALPVLMEELAQRIEDAGESDRRERVADACEDECGTPDWQCHASGAATAYSDVLGIVRGFAAEVTK